MKARFKHVKLKIGRTQKLQREQQKSKREDRDDLSSESESSSDSSEESSDSALLDDDREVEEKDTTKLAGKKRKSKEGCGSTKPQKKRKKDEDDEEDEERKEGGTSEDSHEGDGENEKDGGSSKGKGGTAKGKGKSGKGKGKGKKEASTFSEIQEDTAETVRRVSEIYAVEHNLIQNGKRLRRQEGLASGFLNLGQVSKSIGLGVENLLMPIMKYTGRIMTNEQYNQYTRDCKQVYGVTIGEDENLVFTSEYRSKVLAAAACGHDELHAALVKTQNPGSREWAVHFLVPFFASSAVLTDKQSPVKIKADATTHK
eukprot:g48383.t1